MRNRHFFNPIRGSACFVVIASQVLLFNAEAGQDLIFADSFERCSPTSAVKWDGGGDGESWNDPLNWVGDVFPADDDPVSIRSLAALTVLYDNSAGTTRLSCLNSTAAFAISGGTLQLDGEGWIDDTLSISGAGTLTVSGFLKASGEVQQSGGTVNGPGMVLIPGPFSWSGGTQGGTGETIAYGGITLSGSPRFLDARTLTLNNTGSWTGGDLRLMNAGTLNVNGPLDIQTDADMPYWAGAASTLNINSTLTKSAGSGLTDINGNFNNNGTLTVSSGELNIGRNNAAGTSTGMFQIGSAATLGVRGDHTMTPASSFSGAGGFKMIGGGTTVVQGAYTAAGPLEVNGGTLRFPIVMTLSEDVTVTNGILEFQQATSVNADVILSGGTLTAAAAMPVSGALQHSGGSADGAGTVTVTGPFSWSGGTQGGTGETIAYGGITLSGSPRFLDARTLTLNNTGSWTGGDLRLMNAGTLNVNGPLDIQTDADMPYWAGAASTLNINSTLTKSAGSGLTDINGNFNNNGTLTVSSGELNIGRNNAAGTSTGMFQIGSAATLGVRGDHTMTPASSFSGAGGFKMIGGGTTVVQGAYTAAGPLEVNGGTLRFPIVMTLSEDVTVTNGILEFQQATSVNADVILSGGTLTAAAAMPVSGALQHSGGSADGAGTVTVTGPFSWSGGTQGGTGETIANGGFTLSGSPRFLDARTLTLNNTGSWTGGDLRLMNAGTLNVNGPLDIQTDADMPYWAGAASTLNINSTLTKSAGSGLTDINGNFNNNGTLTVSSGELNIGRNNAAGTSTGMFQIGSAATLGVRGDHTMTPASSFSGAGGFKMIGGGTTVVQGAYTAAGPLEVNGGTLRFPIVMTLSEDVTVTNGILEFQQATSVNADVILSGGTLTAAAAMPVSGALQHSGGSADGAGTVTVTGPFSWSGGTQGGTGETIANGGFTLSGSPRFLDARTLTLNNTGSWTGGDLRLMNAGTLNVNGPLDIQTDADMPYWAGAASTLNINSTLTKSAGSGLTSILGDVNNSGSVEVSAGQISFGRTYTQTGAGSIDVNISSLTSFDRFAISQTATLAGTLNINLLGGYEPALGDQFEIITSNQLMGEFDVPQNGVTIVAGVKKFVVVYDDVTDENVTLEVVPDP